jgi:GntR family transcriptional repressor for pyruvate dehydrogenase complex
MRDQWPTSSSASVHRTLSAHWESLRHTSEALSRPSGVISGAAAENRSEGDVTMLHNGLNAFRHAGSGLPSQEADERLQLAIIDEASAIGREHAKIDLELLESALKQSALKQSGLKQLARRQPALRQSGG